MRIAMFPIKGVEMEKLDEAFKTAGFSTILELSGVSLPNEEKRILAGLLGISWDFTSTRLGIYADKNGIVKVVDIKRKYVKDPVIVVYDRDEERTTSARVERIIVDVLSSEILSYLYQSLGNDRKNMVREILDRAFAAVNSVITDPSTKLQESVVVKVT